jgi:hypothetical protein
MKKDIIRYSPDYTYTGAMLRSFDVFGVSLHEAVGINKIDEKLMVLNDYKHQDVFMVIALIDITVDQFINEFDRLRSLPNTGKGLYDKKQIN